MRLQTLISLLESKLSNNESAVLNPVSIACLLDAIRQAKHIHSTRMKSYPCEMAERLETKAKLYDQLMEKGKQI